MKPRSKCIGLQKPVITRTCDIEVALPKLPPLSRQCGPTSHFSGLEIAKFNSNSVQIAGIMTVRVGMAFKDRMTDDPYPTHYVTKTNNSLAKVLTIFVGLVVTEILDIGNLHHATQELVARWPILGGELITQVRFPSVTFQIARLILYRQTHIHSRPGILLSSNPAQLQSPSTITSPWTFAPPIRLHLPTFTNSPAIHQTGCFISIHYVL
jgi:hypothetical protein